MQPLCRTRKLGVAKVANLDIVCSRRLKENVRWLEIPVDNSKVVEICNATTELADDWARLLLRQGTLLEHIEEFAAGAQFHDEVQLLRRLKHIAKSNNVGMVRQFEDGDLRKHALPLGRHQIILVNHLDGESLAGHAMSGLVDSGKGPLADILFRQHICVFDGAALCSTLQRIVPKLSVQLCVGVQNTLVAVAERNLESVLCFPSLCGRCSSNRPRRLLRLLSLKMLLRPHKRRAPHQRPAVCPGCPARVHLDRAQRLTRRQTAVSRRHRLATYATVRIERTRMIVRVHSSVAVDSNATARCCGRFCTVLIIDNGRHSLHFLNALHAREAALGRGRRARHCARRMVLVRSRPILAGTARASRR
eukprot:Opistho-2@88995